MSNYAINKEFFPFSRFTPPLNKTITRLATSYMKPPRALFHNPNITVTRHLFDCADGAQLEYFLLSPNKLYEKAPCLIYLHGGGFVFPAAGYHYQNAMRYAEEAACKIAFIQYRLAPQYHHPVFFEDCYAALCNLYDHADKLKIDQSRIGIGGDSVGAALAAGLCKMVKDRKHPIQFLFQMLPYPCLDARRASESYRNYPDTPMWNAKLSARMAAMTQADPNAANYVYYSPVEAQSFEGLPPAYIETAEFDCLHDDGILYANQLRTAGIAVTLNETHGTMHGFDIAQKAPTTKAALAARINFMHRLFYGE